MLLDHIKQGTNPFSRDLPSEHLCNIATGQNVSDEVYKFLSTVEIKGEEMHKQFISDSIKKSDRFEERIPKKEISNFASKLKKKS